MINRLVRRLPLSHPASIVTFFLLAALYLGSATATYMQDRTDNLSEICLPSMSTLCEEANTSIMKKEYSDAMFKIRKMYELNILNSCDLAGISDANNVIKVVDQEKLGEYGEAWKTVHTGMVNSPLFAELFRDRFWFKWRELSGKLLEYALIPFVCIVVLMIIVPFSWRRLKFNVDVTDFESCLTGSGNEGFEKVVVAEFEQMLSSISKSSQKKSIGIIEGPGQAIDIPDLSFMPKASAIWNFLEKIIPNNILTIKGSLLYDKERGAGLYIKFVYGQKQKLVTLYEVWQDEFAPDFKQGGSNPVLENFQQLVKPATHMALIELERFKKCFNRIEYLRRLFGTDDSQSYVYATVAQGHYRTHTSSAERMLRCALARDPENYIAWTNLGLVEEFKVDSRVKKEVLDIREEIKNTNSRLRTKELNEKIKRIEGNVKEDYEAALKYQGNAVILVGTKYRKNFAYISARYLQSAINYHIFFNAAVKDQDVNTRTGFTKKDLDYGDRAIEGFRDALEAANDLMRVRRPIINQDVCDAIELALKIAECSNMNEINRKIRTGKDEQALRSIEGYLKNEFDSVNKKFGEKTSTLTLYNLACFNSVIRDMKQLPSAKKDEAAENALDYLKKVFEIEPERAAEANIDWSLNGLRNEPGFQKLIDDYNHEQKKEDIPGKTQEETETKRPPLLLLMAKAFYDIMKQTYPEKNN